MPSTITRGQFVRELAGGGGSLDVDDLPDELQRTLKAAGVDAGDLKRIAGDDAQLRGSKEMSALFDLLDHVDSDGDSKSLALEQDARPTLVGAAYDQLKDEVARRVRSHGIVHFGMRRSSDNEVRALRAETPAALGGVHTIRAYASDGKVAYGGQTHNLGTATGLASFRDALVTGPDRVPLKGADRLVQLLARVDRRSADELAQLGLALHRIGTGDLAANRLVISGHGSGSDVVDDTPVWIRHDTIRDIARIFPQGAGRIEHLAMSACSSAKPAELSAFREDFPGLKSFWGYDKASPSAERGSPTHLATWANLTEGDDPSRVDPRGVNVATWNQVDGKQGFSKVTWNEARLALGDSEWVLDEYRRGGRQLPQGGRDLELDRYYRNLQNALAAPDLPDTARPELKRLSNEVLGFRHPELRR